VSRETVALVEAAFAAWNRGDVSGFIEQEGREVPGRERLERNFVAMLDTWESYRLELEQVHDAGERVVVVVRELARGRSSGLELDSLWGYVVTVSDGKLARVEAYRDPEDALRAWRRDA
jgi:ketosteroid isomerase-like protein